MNLKISDLALDLGVFALDSEIENGEITIAYPFTLRPGACAMPAWHDPDLGDIVTVERPAPVA